MSPAPERRTRVLDDRERLAWLRLIRTDNVGPRTFHELVAHFGSPAAALDALPEISRRGGRRTPLRPAGEEEAAEELDRATSLGARAVALCEPDYPSLLGEIDDAPPILYLRGRAELLDRTVVGIVGARNSSALGRRIAADLAQDLGQADITVASGLARGVDTAAHEAALETGTAAVVAGGIDVVYPPQNEDLMARIADDGVIVSEMPPGTRPGARHFPRRNRLISGLSRGVVIIEAAQRSGSLITARFALEQGREVFAVPGSPLDPRSEGANRLIRDGATLTRSAGDVLEVLGPMVAGAGDGGLHIGRSLRGSDPVQIETGDVADDLRARIVSLIGATPVDIDEVVRASGAPTGAVMAVILELEIAGRLVRPGARQVALIPS